MKRTLKASEKVLLGLCAAVVVLVGAFFAWRNYQQRLAAAREKIAALEPQLTAAHAAAADAAFWNERQAWLDATMPPPGDQGQAHSLFLEQLQTTARERGLVVAAPVMLKPEAGPHHHDLSITLQITGPDQAFYRWLAELQSPEKFQLIKYILLTPLSAQPPRMSGTVTVARLFKA
ncbi:MAG: hypothetical protein ACR2OZ_17960 [Verrucomicrobiales bacterium]